jgi:hypothetical protein
MHTEVVHFGKINIVTVISSYQGVSIHKLFFVQKISYLEKDRILEVQKYCITGKYFP